MEVLIEVQKMIEASSTRHLFVSALATDYPTLGPHFNFNIHMWRYYASSIASYRLGISYRHRDPLL